MGKKEQEAENTKGKETIKIKQEMIREHTMTVPKGWLGVRQEANNGE